MTRRSFVKSSAAMLFLGGNARAAEMSHQSESHESEGTKTYATPEEWWDGKGKEWGNCAYGPEMQPHIDQIRKFAADLNSVRGAGYHRRLRERTSEILRFFQSVAAVHCYPFPSSFTREARANKDLWTFLTDIRKHMDTTMPERMLEGTVTPGLAVRYIAEHAKIPLRLDPQAEAKLSNTSFRIEPATQNDPMKNAMWPLLLRLLTEEGLDLDPHAWETTWTYPDLSEMDTPWRVPAGQLALRFSEPHTSSLTYALHEGKFISGLDVSGTFVRKDAGRFLYSDGETARCQEPDDFETILHIPENGRFIRRSRAGTWETLDPKAAYDRRDSVRDAVMATTAISIPLSYWSKAQRSGMELQHP